MAFRKSQPKSDSVSTSLEFYSHLKWLDGRRTFETRWRSIDNGLQTSASTPSMKNGLPVFNFVLAGRGPKER